jgi:hypothetical protein
MELIWITALRYFLGVVLLAAAIPKLRDISTFEEGLPFHGKLPGGVTRLVAVAVPSVELALALALIAGFLPGWAAAGAVSMLALFTSKTVADIVRGKVVRCNCFSSESKFISPVKLLIRNSLLITISAAVMAESGLTADGLFAGASYTFKHQLAAVVFALEMTLAGYLFLGDFDIRRALRYLRPASVDAAAGTHGAHGEGVMSRVTC